MGGVDLSTGACECMKAWYPVAVSEWFGCGCVSVCVYRGEVPVR